MSQLYVFTGDNEYLIREERKRWVDEFARKYGNDNIANLNGPDVKVRDLLDEVAVLPFLAERRLIVIHGMVRCTKEEASIFVHSIHPNVLVLFVDPKPDKRSAGIKELLASAEVKSFAPVKGSSLHTWIKQYATVLGVRIDAEAQAMLVEYVGEDQGLLSGELDKLATYANGRTISVTDIEKLCIPSDEGIIWKISDMLCGGFRVQAQKYAKRMLDRGGDAHGLWAILLSLLKNIVAVRGAIEEGMRSPKDIAEATGVHIFAVKSLITYAKNIKTNQLHEFLDWSVETDIALKTGSLRASDDAQQEILSVIDTFIAKAP